MFVGLVRVVRLLNEDRVPDSTCDCCDRRDPVKRGSVSSLIHSVSSLWNELSLKRLPEGDVLAFFDSLSWFIASRTPCTSRMGSAPPSLAVTDALLGKSPS